MQVRNALAARRGRNPNFPAKNVKEMIDVIKRNPGKYKTLDDPGP